MTEQEYNDIQWARGNIVRLTNGNEYEVRMVRKNYLLLHSDEFNTLFLADCKIIDARVSDAVRKDKKKKKGDMYVMAAAKKPAQQKKKRPRAKHQDKKTNGCYVK